ncbi:type III PLP-dependent enzyme [Sphaerisporangium sp. NPDC051017]|uniref:type III PLP-dependent enzyme n=1 Tax=Sphaerisporangium sp. NPDC051017 TaxID=3154636 RepID=UPI0034134D41
MYITSRLHAALTAATEDQLVFDLGGIEDRYESLLREFPGISIRFAMKACPVGEVLSCLARKGAGFDAASPGEVAQALRAGAPAGRIHYGNTIKSDRNIAEAYRLGVRDFATDSVEDVKAIAAQAPGARVFCRLATDGDGALWGLTRKFGCSPAEVPLVLETARAEGLTPSGISLHVGSQQMTARAWAGAFDRMAGVMKALDARGIQIDHVNLGGGLPALGYLDLCGRPLAPPLTTMFAVIRQGMRRLGAISRARLDFLMEPGRHLVADHGAVRAHVSRLSTRRMPSGERQHWLYLSCGKFNGLYETDALQYPLVFPSHLGGEYVHAVVAGPTCDSDDVFNRGRGLVQVPRDVASGDPVWILASGAYSASYTTQGFNGFSPLPCTWIHREPQHVLGGRSR